MLQANHSNLPEVAERFLQSTLDALSAHIAILNEKGEIIGVNAAWRQFAENNNYTNPNAGIGLNYLNIVENAAGIHAREAPLVAVGIRDVMQKRRREFYLEYPCHSPEQKRWFVMHVTRYSWNGSSRVIIAHQNVTELKKVQVELFDSEKRIQAILDNVINGIITLDNNGRIETANPAAMATFGYEPEQIVGLPINMLFGGNRGEQDFEHLLTTLQAVADHEVTGRRQDDTEFPMYFALSHVVLGKRRIYTAIIQDVTDRKRMEAEILEKERLRLALEHERELRDLKNRFISMMSHELRTPLASILLSSDMLKLYGDKAPPEEKLMYHNNIHVQVDHLTALIQDVLTISRSDSQSATFMPELTDLVTYCQEITDEFHLNHRETHHILFDATVPSIHTMLDTKLIRQIMNNLISNAIKYSPEGGDVQVRVSNGPRIARVQVQDRGIGIPAADMDRLFEPFHRASNVEPFPGTGLGMAITRQAVEIHGGSIHVESEEQNGTLVTVDLPITLEAWRESSTTSGDDKNQQ